MRWHSGSIYAPLPYHTCQLRLPAFHRVSIGQMTIMAFGYDDTFHTHKKKQILRSGINQHFSATRHMPKRHPNTASGNQGPAMLVRIVSRMSSSRTESLNGHPTKLSRHPARSHRKCKDNYLPRARQKSRQPEHPRVRALRGEGLVGRRVPGI